MLTVRRLELLRHESTAGKRARRDLFGGTVDADLAGAVLEDVAVERDDRRGEGQAALLGRACTGRTCQRLVLESWIVISITVNSTAHESCCCCPRP